MEARRHDGSLAPAWAPIPGMPLDEQAVVFGSIVMSSAEGVIASGLDGKVVWVNPAAAAMFGVPRDQLPGRDLAELLPELLPGQTPDRVTAIGERMLEGEHPRSFATSGMRSDGETFDLSVTPAVRRDTGGHFLGITLILREATPELEAERALRESEARYRAIAETAQEGILAVSPDGDILFANSRLTEIVGLSMDEVYALGRRGMFAPAAAARAARRLAARHPAAGPERSDLPYRHPDGTDRVLHVSASALTAADGSVIGSLAMVSDVTEQRAAEQTLRRQALHDALTGLPNRLLFVDRLNTAAARQRRADGGGVAVLFLDLDHFKRINDTHGHQVGDRVLVEVAARLEHAVRDTDTVARLGGDEFAVICEGADSATSALVAARIQQAFKEPLLVEGEPLEVSLSIGVALSPPLAAEDLLRFADTAMYQAKAHSGGRVVTYDAGPSDDALGRRDPPR